MSMQQEMDKPGRQHLEIIAFCQSCGAKHEFDPTVVGKKAKCLDCGHVFRVPDTREPSAGRSSPPPRRKKAAKNRSPATPPSVPEHSVKDDAEFDPLEALASSENPPADPAQTASSAKVAEQVGEVDVISNPGTDPQTTVTALGVMLGMFYLATIAAGIVLLWAIVGVVLTIWIALPLLVVHGNRAGKRIIFLLIGRATAG